MTRSNDKNEKGKHIPILLDGCIRGLELKDNIIVVDCTVNRAGHSIEILKNLNNTSTLICFDLDEGALNEAKGNIEKYFDSINVKNRAKVIYINSNFRNIKSELEKNNIYKVDAIFADLGVSSQEIDISGRGFSFLKDEPLLMTYSSVVDENVLTAKEIVNNWSEENIANILYNFSDEKYSRRIAKSIINYRNTKDIETTFELNNIIKNSVPESYTRLKTHYSTRTYQALRMAVNSELNAIKDLCESSLEILNKDSIIEFLTFHSVEDRMVKQFFQKHNTDFKKVNTKPIVADREEVGNNPRSRSAKLRIYRRIK